MRTTPDVAGLPRQEERRIAPPAIHLWRAKSRGSATFEPAPPKAKFLGSEESG